MNAKITYVNDVTKNDIVLTNPRFDRFDGFPCVVGQNSEGKETWLEIYSEAEFKQGLETGILHAPVRL
tara:strand:- start:66 stop:269 length:204 start_codon:yes stop_codon:yes gene_type:complete